MMAPLFLASSSSSVQSFPLCCISLPGCTRTLPILLPTSQLSTVSSSSLSAGCVWQPPCSSAVSSSWKTGVSIEARGAAAAAAAATAGQEAEPVPVVVIDQHSEEDATVVELEFGDRLGALLDTMAALRDLGLNVVRGKVTTDQSMGRNRFVITKAGRKVQDAETLEAIRGTIINKLLEFHPESQANLAMARVFDQKATAVQVAVPTTVLLQSVDGGEKSELYVETADYPGLLLDIVKELKDLSIDVSSAEIDTEGLVAKDHFYVSYHGRALDDEMVMTVKNALGYFLERRNVEDEESY